MTNNTESREETQNIEKEPLLRLQAYYYGFDKTGVSEIDLLLASIACAGKAYHHTSDWSEETRPFYSYLKGETPVDWIQNAAISAASQIQDLKDEIERESIEQRVQKWCVECFGETTASDVTERTWRFLEEALELVQSLNGSKADVLKMVNYTYGREKGEPEQELGGTMVTLAALTAANGMDMMEAFETEFSRINQPPIIEKIRAKHANKPHKSPLPGDYKHARQALSNKEW